MINSQNHVRDICIVAQDQPRRRKNLVSLYTHMITLHVVCVFFLRLTYRMNQGFKFPQNPKKQCQYLGCYLDGVPIYILISIEMSKISAIKNWLRFFEVIEAHNNQKRSINSLWLFSPIIKTGEKSLNMHLKVSISFLTPQCLQHTISQTTHPKGQNGI